MKTWIKLFSFFGCILLFMLIASLISLFIRDKWKAILFKSHLLRVCSKLGLSLLSIEVCGEIKKNDESRLIVSNHLSYLDVLIIASRLPTTFVTSVEIKETPFLGPLTQIAGCLFVERRKKDNLSAEIDELRQGLIKNINITIFPEATSTNGEQILRFRRPLFHSAILSQKSIHPVCLNYLTINRLPVNKSNRDKVFWYGDMTFFSHLVDVCRLSQIKVELKSLDPLCSKEINTVESLAEFGHALLVLNYIPIV